MLRLIESPTSLAAGEYCQRIPYLMQIKPFGGEKSSAMMAGQIEHEYFEQYLKLWKIDATSKKNLFSLKLHQDRKSSVTKFIEKLARVNHPEFLETATKTLKSLNYRINGFFKILLDEATRHFAENLTLKQTTNLLFPVHIEYWFDNHKYGIRGKADFVYNADPDGRSLIIVDIKSHFTRISGYMHQAEHRQQMIVYAVLAEWEFNIPVNLCRIFYSQDLTFEDFYISNTDKAEAIENRNRRKTMMEVPMAPRLTGDDAYKCEHCFHARFCEQVGNNGDSTVAYSPPDEPSYDDSIGVAL